MKRALGFIAIALGTAWVLGGTGSVVSGLDANSRLDDLRNDEIASLETRTTEKIADLEARRTDVEAEGEAGIVEATDRVANLKGALDAVEQEHEAILEAKRQSVVEATDGGRRRTIARAETALARATRRKDAAIRRPQAKLQKAEAEFEDAKAVAAERLAKVDAQITRTREASQSELTALKAPESAEASQSVLLPLLAAVLGLALLGLGIVLAAARPRSPMSVAYQMPVEAAMADADEDEPSPTLDALPAVERAPRSTPPAPVVTDVSTPEEPTMTGPRA